MTLGIQKFDDQINITLGIDDRLNTFHHIIRPEIARVVAIKNEHPLPFGGKDIV